MTERRASEILASCLSQARAKNLLNDGGALTDQDISMMKQQISSHEIGKLVTYLKARNTSKGTTAPKSHGTGATRSRQSAKDTTRQSAMESDSYSDDESVISKERREHWKMNEKGKAAKLNGSFNGGFSSSEDEA